MHLSFLFRGGAGSLGIHPPGTEYQTVTCSKLLGNSACTFAALIMLTGIIGCGIYETTGALNPPFGQQITESTLQFTGDNSEDYFAGYVLWYKEDESEEYTVCVYRGEADIPTIPKDETSTVNTYAIDIGDLQPIDENASFIVLQDEGRFFYFAVSSYGVDGEESEKVEFGKWPVQ